MSGPPAHPTPPPDSPRPAAAVTPDLILTPVEFHEILRLRLTSVLGLGARAALGQAKSACPPGEVPGKRLAEVVANLVPILEQHLVPARAARILAGLQRLEVLGGPRSGVETTEWVLALTTAAACTASGSAGDLAERLADEAMRLAPLGSVEVAEALLQRGRSNIARSHHGDGQQDLLKARSIFEREGHIARAAYSGYILGKSLRLTGEFARAAKLLHEALSLARTEGSPLPRFRLHLEQAHLRVEVGAFSEAEEDLAVTRELSDELGFGSGLPDLIEGKVAKVQGHYRQAQELLERGEIACQRDGYPRDAALGSLALIEIMIKTNQIQAALDRLERTEPLVLILDDFVCDVSLQRAKAMYQSRVGDPAVAEEEFRHGLNTLMQARFPYQAAETYLEMALFFKKQGNLIQAVYYGGRAQMVAREIGAGYLTELATQFMGKLG